MGAYCCSSQEPTKDDFSVENEVKDHNVVVFSKPGCTDSLRAKTLLYSIDALPKVIEVNKRTYYLKEKLKLETKKESFPYIFIFGKFIGGYEELQSQINKGTIQKMLKDENNKQTQ